MYYPFWNESEEHELAISCINDILDYVPIHEDFFSPLRVVLCGDFNDSRKYYTTISSVTQLKVPVEFPTRSDKTFDQIFSSIKGYNTPSMLPSVGRSDHSVILWNSEQKNAPYIYKIIRCCQGHVPEIFEIEHF